MISSMTPLPVPCLALLIHPSHNIYISNVSRLETQALDR